MNSAKDASIVKHYENDKNPLRTTLTIHWNRRKNSQPFVEKLSSPGTRGRDCITIMSFSKKCF